MEGIKILDLQKKPVFPTVCIIYLQSECEVSSDVKQNQLFWTQLILLQTTLGCKGEDEWTQNYENIQKFTNQKQSNILTLLSKTTITNKN